MYTLLLIKLMILTLCDFGRDNSQEYKKKLEKGLKTMK